MKIYFCGSIAGGREYLATYQKVVEYLKELGHQVLTEHVVRPDVVEYEEEFTPEQIYSRDVEWLEECDCIVSEVSKPSLGVGYEIGYALNMYTPVLCLYEKGIFLSRMLTGNSSEGLLVKDYGTEEDWKKIIDLFFSCF